MVLAQALVERGMLEGIVASIWSALQQVDYYIGQGNAKWALVALAVVLGYFFLKPHR